MQFENIFCALYVTCKTRNQNKTRIIWVKFKAFSSKNVYGPGRIDFTLVILGLFLALSVAYPYTIITHHVILIHWTMSLPLAHTQAVCYVFFYNLGHGTCSLSRLLNSTNLRGNFSVFYSLGCATINATSGKLVALRSFQVPIRSAHTQAIEKCFPLCNKLYVYYVIFFTLQSCYFIMSKQ